MWFLSSEHLIIINFWLNTVWSVAMLCITLTSWNVFNVVLWPSLWSIFFSVIHMWEKYSILLLTASYYIDIYKVNLIDTVQFYVLIDLSSTCSINNLEMDVKVFNCDYGFLIFSSFLLIFCFMYSKILLLGITDLTLLLLLLLSILLLGVINT